MRSFLLKSSLIIGLLSLLLITSSIAMAVFSPFSPGNLLFPVQNFSELLGSRIFSDPEQKASFMLDLVELRIQDLNTRIGSINEHIAFEYLNQAIDQASLAIVLVPQDKVEQLRTRLSTLAEQAGESLSVLKRVPIENNGEYVAFRSKLNSILHEGKAAEPSSNLFTLMAENRPMHQEGASVPINYPSSANGLIPFPPGSLGAVHAFYPLTGQHAVLDCSSCHNAGKYLGTPNECIQCHLLKLPNPHYPGLCELCHSAASWEEIHFEHNSAAASDCASCHDKDTPADHYNGQCSACHITQAWNIVSFDHAVAGAVDCASCHAKVEPANHYPGQCSNCHNTSDWKSVVFNHIGLSDCTSCHTKDAPGNHYAGQCSSCHDSGGTWQNAHFNHSGFADCSSCHSGNAPANHYPGQCSNCHDPNSTWQNAQFNHSGYTDCISCHAGNAPGNHYPGQCSNCHDPNSSWQNAHFNHSGYTDCVACHAGNAPGNHYPGQCSNCHSTSSWSGAVFNHSGYSDCIACHQNDRPSDHDSGQCSECHNTQHWGDGGGDGALGFITNGILQPFSCTVCHTPNYALVESGIRQ